MEPSNNKPEYPMIIAVILVALCCLTLPLLLGAGIAGLGFFTSPWVVALGVLVLLGVLWMAYQRYKK